MSGLAALVPAYVRVVELRDPGDLVDTLLPGEREVVADAAPARRAEFAAGRWCARRALDALGRPPVVVLPGPAGAPTWPDGVRGSLTHCAGYAAVALAEADLVEAVGIDAEPAGPLPDGVLEVVATPAERAALRARPPGVPWDLVLFCAKEAAFKVCSAYAGAWVDPQRMVVTIGRGGFAVALADPVRLGARDAASLTGRWSYADGLVRTAVVVARH